MEARTAIHDRFGVLGNLAVEHDIGLIVIARDGILRAHTDASAAADALIMVNACLAVCNGDCTMRTHAGTHTASDASLFMDTRLACVVHLHLTGTRAAAHADILERTAKTGVLVTLEVVQRDKYVGIHDRRADLSRLDVLTALDRDVNLIRALQAVTNDDMAASGQRRKTVEISRIQMIERVLTSADVQGIAVGQEGLAAVCLDVICSRLCPVRPQKCQITRLTKVHLDCGVLFIKVNRSHSRLVQQSPQLLL